MKGFGPALGVANAVLYEGYLLFPYTASTQKNRVRWQFGVVVPRQYLAAGTCEHAEQQTEILFERDVPAEHGIPAIDVVLRFLHVEARSVEVARDGGFEPAPSFELDGTTYLSFDEAVERELPVEIRPPDALEQRFPLRVVGSRGVEELRDRAGEVRARIVRECWPLEGMLTIGVEPSAESGDAGRVSKLRVRVENHSAVVAGERSSALRTSLVSTHVLLAIAGGRFLSVLDPPPHAAAATANLANRQTFPVLVGDAHADARRAELVLSSPIILYDFPALNARTEADAFDATEIDELLTLSVLSLSDAERAEARATDPRARALVERAESFGAQGLARLHASALQRAGAEAAAQAPPAIARLADPFADGAPTAGFAGDPGLALDRPPVDCVSIGGVNVTRGCAVRLHPRGRADLWDSLLDGKRATVRAIHQDLEDRLYVAVTVDDDPASDLHEWYGRSFFFAPEEVEPVAGSGA
jgi:hypothetical protein